MNINMDKILKENNRISLRESMSTDEFTSIKMERFKYITKSECQIRQQYEQRKSVQLATM